MSDDLILTRQGTCDRCGQCCGADGSPYQDNPWPKRWYWTDGSCAFANRDLADLLAVWPQAVMFGVIAKAGGGCEIPDPLYGSIRVTGPGGGMYYWVWVPGHAVCKDTSPGHDGSAYALECPFLKPDPGDGSRPCGLVSTNSDNAFRVACEAQPPATKTEAEVINVVDGWATLHPACSYTWAEL